MKAKQKTLIALYLLLTIYAIISVMPVLMTVVGSFKETLLVRSPVEIFSFRELTFANYQRAFGFGQYFHFLRNSIVITVSTVVATLVACTSVAYGLTKMRNVRLRNWLAFLVLSLRFIPYAVFAIPLFIIAMVLRLTGTYVGIVAAYMTIMMPLSIWLLRSFFEEIPREIEESAIVDGCRPFRIFWNIAIPMVQSGMIANAILVFVISWNEFLYARFIAGFDVQPLTVGISRFMGAEGSAPEHAVIAAYSVLIAMPIILFSVVVSRYIIRGLTAGAVKG